MKTPNFAKQENALYQFSNKALKKIGKKHKDAFAYFAFDCNVDYGEVLLCLDTIENSVTRAKKVEMSITRNRKKYTYQSSSFEIEWAIHNLGNDLIGRVTPFSNNTGDFSHQGFAMYNFKDWEDFSLSDDYPGVFEESGEDYLSCISVILLSNVIDLLIDGRAFDQILKSTPFYCGIGLHDNVQKVVRIINWDNDNNRRMINDRVSSKINGGIW